MEVMDKLIQEAPSLGAIILVVWMFMKSIEKRDTLFSETLREQRLSFVNALKTFTDKIDTFEAVLMDLDNTARSAMKLRRRAVKVKKKNPNS